MIVFTVNMSIFSKGFEEAEERLEELYAKCDCLMADNAESSLRFVIREISEDSKQLLQTRLKKHYEFRCKLMNALLIIFKVSLPRRK